ncbi:uncharacterized protein LOC109721587 isoform X2 [Ananas comosus]|uniref:Uncharacterized protein LOC109721587 isoform X2 n=1 Tax=Ananas comosus TaxID=4615 RepID=A0A6P5GAL2_ANACO|nr:uncharacterized protein LOC109721587 isoform X2 [Ananas comosus]
MGNCQAAEAATVVIEHPGGRVERFYWSLSACHVMAANPGHYVAAVIVTATTPPAPAAPAAAAHPVKHLKLLRPDDTLLIGRVYRLVTFEEVLREFASKQRVKLSRLTVKQKGNDDTARQMTSCGGIYGRCKRQARKTEQGTAPATMHAQAASATSPTSEEPSAETEAEAAAVASGSSGGRRQAHQWRPALESIAESAGS